jgi:hypothetical protein
VRTLDLTVGLNTDDERFMPGRIAASLSRAAALSRSGQ